MVQKKQQVPYITGLVPLQMVETMAPLLPLVTHMCFSPLLQLYLNPAFLIHLGVDKELGPVDPNFSLLKYDKKYLFQSLKLGYFENQRGSLQMEVPEWSST